MSAVAIYGALQDLMKNMKSVNQHNFFSAAVKSEMEDLQKEGHRLNEFKGAAMDVRGN